jgi:hypothetical protein
LEAVNLVDGGGKVPGVGLGHGLDSDRVTPPHWNPADMNGASPFSQGGFRRLHTSIRFEIF